MRRVPTAALSTLGLVVAMATQACGAVWTEYSSNPVYDPGKAYYPTIVKDGGTYKMWSDGTSGLQMATSADGINWSTQGIATGLTAAKHSLVEKIGTEYRMWYWPGLSYGIGDIRTATSTDGLTWSNDQALTQVGKTVINNTYATNWNRGSYGAADVIYNPSGSSTIVLPVDEASVWANKYVMYYDGTPGNKESLGLAVSNDGLNWQGYDPDGDGISSPVFTGSGVSGDWDSGYSSRATVVRVNDDLYEMWYSGGTTTVDYGIGYATSADGITWTRDASNPIFDKNDGVAWRNSRTYTPVVIGNEMWFTGVSSSSRYSIGYATSKNGDLDTVPEPSTFVIWSCLGGLGTIVGWRRRKRTA
jgi:hypothetical protein